MIQSNGNWDLIVRYMHYKGDKRDVLPEDIMWKIYCAADGFGRLPPRELEQINGGWDWSHIRDSSEQAINLMSAIIRRYERERNKQKKQKKPILSKQKDSDSQQNDRKEVLKRVQVALRGVVC